MFSNKERDGINYILVCALSLYVTETPNASIKEPGTPLPIMPFDNVMHSYVGQRNSCISGGKKNNNSGLHIANYTI